MIGSDLAGIDHSRVGDIRGRSWLRKSRFLCI